ncbi:MULTISPECIES: LysE family transporter [unclassified Polaribacter]|uniref:LysE family transporter n=1 Tax=unclassified Polaribacter TaxID=196858 RepID=UPI0011BE5013|nr:MULTISPECIES: LysE family transporter [unclassified Polaribacter]TXD52804.1 glutamate dehydrogenase [Polaribacter sp. IC063]TXD61681.1 glutamate dehydrogenase [Polaribacter sp. IC066]
MILISLFFFGFFAAFIGSITPSMLNMTALKISLEKGRTASNKYALGVSLVVILQVIIAVILTKYVAENPAILETLEKAGIVIFIFLSYFFYSKSKKEKSKIETSKIKKENLFLKGVTLSLLNMFGIPFFCGVATTLDYFNLFSFDIISIVFFTLSAGIGTFFILSLYGKFAKIIQKKTGKLTKDINLILAILTGLVAVLSILKLLF